MKAEASKSCEVRVGFGLKWTYIKRRIKNSSGYLTKDGTDFRVAGRYYGVRPSFWGMIIRDGDELTIFHDKPLPSRRHPRERKHRVRPSKRKYQVHF
jgi:hypothetical protein